jgi:hypothetical protein
LLFVRQEARSGTCSTVIIQEAKNSTWHFFFALQDDYDASCCDLVERHQLSRKHFKYFKV